MAPLPKLTPHRAYVAIVPLVLAACSRPEPATDAAGPDAKAPSAATSSAPATDPHEPSGPAALIAWLDPDAVAAAYLRLPPEVDLAALATAFALPDRTATLLRHAGDTARDLDAVVPPGEPRPTTFFTPELLATVPASGRGEIVIRRLKVPVAQVEAALRSARMHERTAEGLRLFEPRGALPWSVVILTDDLVAFVPAKIMGAGVSPLSAARDLPPSDLEQQLGRVLEERRDTMLELAAAGPLVHLDLDAEVLGLRAQVIPWGEGGLDGQVRLAISGDPQAAVRQLGDRTMEGEPTNLVELARKVAWVVEPTDPPAVLGRLQIPREDVRGALARPR